MCLFNHSSICAAIILFSYGMNKPLAVGSAFVLIPVGLFLNTFGVFGGLGAGQFAFDILLPGIMAGGSRGDGTMLATLFHLTFFCAKLSGLPFYLQGRRTSGIRTAAAAAEAAAAEKDDPAEMRPEQRGSFSS
jgi:hypothetical protein